MNNAQMDAVYQTTLSPFGVTAKLSPIYKLAGESLAGNFWAGVSVPLTRAAADQGAADQGRR